MNTTAESLAPLRARIEAVDAQIVTLLAERQDLSAELAAAKHAAGVPIVDLAREADVLRRATDHARAVQLDEDVVRHIFWCLIDLSRRAQLAVTQ